MTPTSGRLRHYGIATLLTFGYPRGKTRHVLLGALDPRIEADVAQHAPSGLTGVVADPADLGPLLPGVRLAVPPLPFPLDDTPLPPRLRWIKRQMDAARGAATTRLRVGKTEIELPARRPKVLMPTDVVLHF